MGAPLLSVFVITYKQAAFIKQAITGILNQETQFDYELIIANDCSPDHTGTIIEDIQASHPKGHVIRYYEQSENLGMYGNFMFALNQCRGQYVAICEGDDYWTDPNKLQLQVDFLESHPEYEVCFTNISIVDEDGHVVKEVLIADDRKTDYERSDLPIWAPTLTRVFRNRDFNKLPTAPGLDTIMLLWQSEFGKIKFIDINTGAYRLHEGGIYSAESTAVKKEQVLQTLIVSLSIIDSSLYSKYFGMLFKKLVELGHLNRAIYKVSKQEVDKAFNLYKGIMSFSLYAKIKFAFLLILFPIDIQKRFQSVLFKIFDRLFIY
ncbi:glycosyltransferase family 2 protein [Hanstruepera flava]|uniref:glycosyltransferase family 2 protein n=1 Tax=Hanstruepera flava TaxID=2930218 RepID=UPI002028FA16|nr:glycosyltransferase [Hanstruepera flava]